MMIWFHSISIFELRIHEIFLEILLFKHTYETYERNEFVVLALADTKNILKNHRTNVPDALNICFYTFRSDDFSLLLGLVDGLAVSSALYYLIAFVYASNKQIIIEDIIISFFSCVSSNGFE